MKSYKRIILYNLYIFLGIAIFIILEVFFWIENSPFPKIHTVPSCKMEPVMLNTQISEINLEDGVLNCLCDIFKENTSRIDKMGSSSYTPSLDKCCSEMKNGLINLNNNKYELAASNFCNVLMLIDDTSTIYHTSLKERKARFEISLKLSIAYCYLQSRRYQKALNEYSNIAKVLDMCKDTCQATSSSCDMRIGYLHFVYLPIQCARCNIGLKKYDLAKASLIFASNSLSGVPQGKLLCERCAKCCDDEGSKKSINALFSMIFNKSDNTINE